MKRDDGGSAFPCIGSVPDVDWPGMSLRDYFAAHALAGLLARRSSDVPHCAYADISYRYADALIAERAK